MLLFYLFSLSSSSKPRLPFQLDLLVQAVEVAVVAAVGCSFDVLLSAAVAVAVAVVASVVFVVGFPVFDLSFAAKVSAVAVRSVVASILSV